MASMGTIKVYLLMELDVPIEAGTIELGGERSAIIPLTLDEEARVVSAHNVPHDMAVGIRKRLEIRLIKESL